MTKNNLKKLNKVLVGSSLALNTLQLTKPGANPSYVLSSSIGIGATGIITDKLLSFDYKKKKRKK